MVSFMSTIARVRVFKERQALSQSAAQFIVETGAEAVRQRGRFLLVLSGGGTPEPVYRLLASEQYRAQLDWTASHFFWGDERCVAPTGPGSNYGQAARLMLDALPIPAGNLHRIKGELEPEEAAADYSRRLADFAGEGLAWPAFDLALMGMGSDGHTASLFPGPPAPDEDRLAAIAVTADYEDRPAQRVSLTPPVFNSARSVLFLVTGAAKAQAVAAVLAPEADPVKWPAARIQPGAGRLHFFLDQAAATAIA
jgi:6-phosphogluconolactonase